MDERDYIALNKDLQNNTNPFNGFTLCNYANKLPNKLLYSNGQPTEEWLKYINEFNPNYDIDVVSFVKEVLPNGWHNGCVKVGKKHKGITKVELHTYGWSGNEDVIRAILSNIYFTAFCMKYVMWRSGGHYYFEITDKNT